MKIPKINTPINQIKYIKIHKYKNKSIVKRKTNVKHLAPKLPLLSVKMGATNASVSRSTVTNTNTQIHMYINTPIHKYINTNVRRMT